MSSLKCSKRRLTEKETLEKRPEEGQGTGHLGTHREEQKSKDFQ